MMSFWCVEDYDQEECIDVGIVEQLDFSDSLGYALETRSPFLYDIVTLEAILPQEEQRARKKKKNTAKLDFDQVLCLASYEDKAVAKNIIDAVDPQLLDLVLEYLVPDADENLYDRTNPKNHLRNLFIKAGKSPPMSKLKEAWVVSAKEGVALADKNGTVLVSGKPDEVLKYAAQYCSSDLGAIYRQMRSAQVKHVGFKTLQQLLANYRMERMCYRGAEKLSKISQLGTCNADNPYFWFSSVPHNTVVVDTGVDWRALLRFDKVIKYKPGATTGVLLVDAVRGGHDGAKTNDWDKLDGFLLDGREVVSLCVFDDRLRAHKGEIIGKPRPHNLVCVVEFGDHGPDLGAFWDRFEQNVVYANELRNGRRFGAGGVGRNFSHSLDSYMLDLWTTNICAADVWAERTQKHRAKHKTLGSILQVKEILTKEDHNFFYVKPLDGEYTLVPGMLWRSAVEGVDPVLQASILYHLAKSTGTVYYRKGHWRYKSSN